MQMTKNAATSIPYNSANQRIADSKSVTINPTASTNSPIKIKGTKLFQ